MAKIFITSDTFFGRKSILEIANRPFKNISMMERTIIKNWNEKVSKADTVYFLGNFAHDPSTLKRILPKLNGKIKFILGSDDGALKELYPTLKKEYDFLPSIFLDEENDIILSHYPLEEWKGMNRGVLHFHGYSLYRLKTDLDQRLRVNACIDNWNYSPLSLDAIREFIKERTSIQNNV
jgi:calcineurin-like phosphoesterase family protein